MKTGPIAGAGEFTREVKGYLVEGVSTPLLIALTLAAWCEQVIARG